MSNETNFPNNSNHPQSANIPAESIAPFTRFCCTLGMIPSSYKASMTYEEQLMWLCDYLENTVIPTVNNNTDVTNETQDLFNQLHDYVEHYFDNLDVQQEINNKLDEMATDGTLISIIAPYLQPYIDEQNDRIHNVENFVYASVNINPLIASDVSEMTDTTRIYVNTSNGYWYYYDGTSWQQGGLYQSSGIANNSIVFPYLNDDITQIFSKKITGTTTVENYFIKYSDGSLVSNNYYDYITGIQLKKDETLFVRGYALASISVISKIDNGTIKPLVQGISEQNVNDYSYTADEDITLAICVRKDKSFHYFRFLSSFDLLDKIDILYNTIDYHIPSFSPTNEKYITLNGTIGNSTVYSYTSPIELKKGETIFAHCAAGDTISVISKYDSVNQTYTSLVAGQNTSTPLDYSYTADENMLIVISYRTSLDNNFLILFSSKEIFENLDNKIKNTNTNFNNKFHYKKPTFTLTSGKYINIAGNQASSTAYSFTSPIELKKGETIFASCVANNLCAIFAKYDSLADSYTPLIIGRSEGTEILDYSYTADKDINIVISFRTTYGLSNYIEFDLSSAFSFLDNKISTNEENISIINNEMRFNKLLMFNYITGIGDSLTYGQVYISDTSPRSRQAYSPYPEILGKLINAEVDNLGESGATAQSWWNSHSSDLTNTNKDNLFIVYLGTNYGLTDTLDTDAPVNTDYNTWADTNTGCYAKIVAKCLDLGGKVLLIPPHTVGGEGSDYDTTIDVINQISQRFNVPCINPIKLTGNIYHFYPDLSGTNSLHLNDYGYSIFAQRVIEEINKLSDTNFEKLFPA